MITPAFNLLSEQFYKSLKLLASRKGFEPLTYGLGNRCSILLSYRDARERRNADDRTFHALAQNCSVKNISHGGDRISSPPMRLALAACLIVARLSPPHWAPNAPPDSGNPSKWRLSTIGWTSASPMDA